MVGGLNLLRRLREVCYAELFHDVGLLPSPLETCHLMTGADDGTTRALALHPFQTDAGLSVRSKASDVHARLITAEHNRIDAVLVASAPQGCRPRKAEAQLQTVHAQQAAAIGKAKTLQSDAQIWADNHLAPAQARLECLCAEKQAKVTAVQTEADGKAHDAHDTTTAAGHAQLCGDLVAKTPEGGAGKRDACGFADDGSALKVYSADDD